MRRRLLILGDQAVSSISNLAVIVLVARTGTPAAVGAFSLSMIVYQLVVGAIRSVAGEPLLSLYSHEPTETRRGVLADLLGSTMLLGASCSLVIWLLAVVVGGPAGSGLGALALVLPLVLVQDTWRFVFVIDRPGRALTTDIVWLAAMLGAIPLLGSGTTVGQFVLAWGVAGGIGGAVGTWLGGLPRISRRPWGWLVDHRTTAWRYLADFGVAKGAASAVLLALPVISGAAVLGAVRAAQVFYGFVNVAHAGFYLVFVPEGARLRSQPRRMRRLFVRASAVSTLVPVAWMVLGLALPDGAWRSLFGETWDEAARLLVPIGLAVTAGGVLSGALLGVRALGDARLNLRARLYCTPFKLVLPLAGAMVGDAAGFAIGLGLSLVATAVIWWTMFAGATATVSELLHEPDPGRDGDDPARYQTAIGGSALQPGVR